MNRDDCLDNEAMASAALAKLPAKISIAHGRDTSAGEHVASSPLVSVKGTEQAEMETISLTPTDAPAGQKLLLNAYGRRCYNAGRDAGFSPSPERPVCSCGSADPQSARYQHSHLPWCDLAKSKAERPEAQRVIALMVEDAGRLSLARDAIDLHENDVPKQHCLLRLSVNDLASLNRLLRLVPELASLLQELETPRPRDTHEGEGA